MKIRDEFKVREMAGEYIIIMQGSYGADMTKVISLNESALFLWETLKDREFEVAEVVDLLTEHYEIDLATAQKDAALWIEKLGELQILK